MAEETANILRVGISEAKVGEEGDRLVTSSLGSCVGIVLYSVMKRVGGMTHVLLPKRLDGLVDGILEEMDERGASLRNGIKGYIVGGACMFSGVEGKRVGELGRRNVDKAREKLEKERIKIAGEDVGGHHGRSLELDITTGKVTVKSMKKGEKQL